MSFESLSIPVYTQGFGTSSISGAVIQTRAPAASDIAYPLGQEWIVATTNSVYYLTSQALVSGVLSSTWTIAASGSFSLSTLTGDTGTATPSSGNIKIAGTANQITTAASGATVTLSIPSIFMAPGSITAASTLTATLGNITATNGNLSLGTAGNKIVIATGSNASIGTSAAMAGTPGSIIVATTACSATAKIFYSRATTGGTTGDVSITAQDGTGFTLTSTGNETSTFNWLICNL